jgi:hypothetical protein
MPEKNYLRLKCMAVSCTYIMSYTVFVKLLGLTLEHGALQIETKAEL